MLMSIIPAAVERLVSSLRFPYLFLLAALIFGADLLIPDLIPFADEILLGLLTVLLGAIRKRKGEPEIKDVTPPVETTEP